MEGKVGERKPGRNGLVVRKDLVIPEVELEMRASRSGGPGGQNVNKVATRVELRFHLESSSVLDAAEKARVKQRLAGRITGAGILRVQCQMHRSRHRNEEEARERLATLVRQALQEQRRRRPTKPTRASREKRLEAKRQRARNKRRRTSLGEPE